MHFPTSDIYFKRWWHTSLGEWYGHLLPCWEASRVSSYTGKVPALRRARGHFCKCHKSRGVYRDIIFGGICPGVPNHASGSQHWDWDTAQTPTGGSSGEYCTMGETLMQRRRVSDEVFRYVKLYQQGRKWRYLTKKPRLTTLGGELRSQHQGALPWKGTKEAEREGGRQGTSVAFFPFLKDPSSRKGFSCLFTGASLHS